MHAVFVVERSARALHLLVLNALESMMGDAQTVPQNPWPIRRSCDAIRPTGYAR